MCLGSLWKTPTIEDSVKLLHSRELSEQEFKREFISVFTLEYSETKREFCCGQCKFYDDGCTTSELENRYGNGNTKACSEFEIKSEYK